jgi:hypothetical protein
VHQPIKSLHHVIDDAQRTERTWRDIVNADQTGLPQRELGREGRWCTWHDDKARASQIKVQLRPYPRDTQNG